MENRDRRLSRITALWKILKVCNQAPKYMKLIEKHPLSVFLSNADKARNKVTIVFLMLI